MKTAKISAVIALFALVAVIIAAVPYAAAQTDNKFTNKLDSCRAAYLRDYHSGEVLLAHNENDRYPVASMVKITSLLLIFEAVESGVLSMDENISVSPAAAAAKGSELFIDAGAEYPASDLIKGIIVVSANDACVAMAERIAGSETAFTALMNEKAKSMGLVDTLYSNSTGYPSEAEQYSSAKDVSELTAALLSHEEYYRYSSIWLEEYTHPSGRKTCLTNTNKLIRFYDGCDGGKTGYTAEAKHSLSATAKRGDTRVVATVVGAQNSDDRFGIVRSMFDYTFANYKTDVKYLSGETVCSAPVERGDADSVNLVADKTLAALTKRGESGEYTVRYDIDKVIRAPITKGQVLGKVSIMDGDKEKASVMLYADNDVKKAGFFDYFKDIIEQW